MNKIIKSIIFKQKYIYIKGNNWSWKIPKDDIILCNIESNIEPPIEEINYKIKSSSKTRFIIEWGSK